MSSPRCFRCGRALKNPASQDQCYGPVCWKKVPAEAVADESERAWDYATGGEHPSLVVGP